MVSISWFIVSLYANVDEAIPIQIRKERTTEAYKEKMNQEIETIDKYENRTVVQRTKWRPIYEVMDEDYIKNTHIFPDDFIRECKKNQTTHKKYQVM